MDTFDYDQYRQSHRPARRSAILSVFLVVIGGLLALSFANILSYAMYSSGLSLLTGYDSRSTDYYAVAVAYCTTQSEAQTLAQTLTLQGGAGYIQYDGTYRVLAQCYSSRKDAEKVVSNIRSTYPQATVYQISVPKFNYPTDMSKTQLSATKNIVQTMSNTLSSLYSISSDYDTESADISTARTRISALISTYSTALNDYTDAMLGEMGIKYSHFTTYLHEFADKLSLISDLSTTNNEFSAQIKYTAINCLFSYRSAVKKL